MKHILFIGFLFVLVISVFGQNPYFDFGYERSERSVIVVDSRNIDTLIRMEKVVLEGFDFKIPFFHFLNKRNTNNSYVI